MAFQLRGAGGVGLRANTVVLLCAQGGSNAFASALWLPPYSNEIDAKVVIGYGMSNAESRALVVSMDYFEELFVWCA